jgi:hypothetical protein
MANRFCRFVQVIAVIVAASAVGTAIEPPRLRIADWNGRDVDPFAQPDAGVIVFVFLRSDCPIANGYAPELRRLHQEFSTRAVRFWLVYVDADETAAHVREHMKEFDLQIPALRDARHALTDYCGARVTPEAAVFSAQGRKVYCGRIDDSFTELGRQKAKPSTRELAESIEAALAGKSVTRPQVPATGCPIAELR